MWSWLVVVVVVTFEIYFYRFIVIYWTKDILLYFYPKFHHQRFTVVCSITLFWALLCTTSEQRCTPFSFGIGKVNLPNPSFEMKGRPTHGRIAMMMTWGFLRRLGTLFFGTLIKFPYHHQAEHSHQHRCSGTALRCLWHQPGGDSPWAREHNLMWAAK